MVLNLVIIGLAITLMPLTLLAFILILGTQHGLVKGLAFILGWTACLVVVIAATLLLTNGKPPRPHTAPSTAALVAKAILGGVLIWVGLRRRHRLSMPPKPRKEPGWMARLDHLSPWAAAGLGVFLQPWSLVAAAAATVVQADLSSASSWLALFFFCLVATSSYIAAELYAAFAPAAAAVRFDQIHKWIDTHQDQAIVAGALVVGAWLLADSIFLIVS
jgi:hypothetical protein